MLERFTLGMLFIAIAIPVSAMAEKYVGDQKVLMAWKLAAFVVGMYMAEIAWCHMLVAVAS